MSIYSVSNLLYSKSNKEFTKSFKEFKIQRLRKVQNQSKNMTNPTFLLENVMNRSEGYESSPNSMCLRRSLDASKVVKSQPLGMKSKAKRSKTKLLQVPSKYNHKLESFDNSSALLETTSVNNSRKINDAGLSKSLNNSRRSSICSSAVKNEINNNKLILRRMDPTRAIVLK